MQQRKKKNGDTLTVIQAPKEYADELTGEEYKGSKYEKKTEVDVENEKIKKVSTNTSLFLETQKENEETLDFGLQNFTYDISSEIKSTKNEENKYENVQLVKKLSEKISFIKSDDLMKSLLLEKEKDSELNETLDENEDFEKIVKKEENEEKSEIELNNSKQVRQLGWEGSISRTWTLASSNILGKTVQLQYEIKLSGGKLSNTLIVSCGSVKFSYGNTGTTTNKSKPEKKTPNKTLFKIPFPGTPVPITFSFGIGGSIGYDVYFNTYTNQLKLSYTGELTANGELGAGANGLAEIVIGAEGTIISITAENTFTKSGYSYIASNSIYVSGGKINCYVSGTLLNHEVFKVSKDFVKGWSRRLY